MSTLSLWTRRDPFADFDALARRAFGSVYSAPSGGLVPAADLTRDGDDAVVSLELPGLDANSDVTVEVDGNQLVVRGERRDERTGQRSGDSFREMRYGSFRRSFTLPEHVTADAVSASYDAGVLRVRVAGAYAGGGGARRIPVSTAKAAPAMEGGAPAESGESAQSRAGQTTDAAAGPAAAESTK